MAAWLCDSLASSEVLQLVLQSSHAPCSKRAANASAIRQASENHALCCRLTVCAAHDEKHLQQAASDVTRAARDVSEPPPPPAEPAELPSRDPRSSPFRAVKKIVSFGKLG